MTDIDQHLDETIDLDERQVDAGAKWGGWMAGEMVGQIHKTDDKLSKLDDPRASFPRSSGIEDTEDLVDGYDSDFQLEESRGLRCMPSSQSLTHCLIGKSNNPE